MSMFGSDFRRDAEIRHFPLLLYVLLPFFALLVQTLLPRILGPYVWLDLPLLVTVYFAMARRSPLQGIGIGAFMGLFQDALTHHALGVNGIAKTIVGFLASSVGVRIDLENHTIRILLTFGLSLLSSAVYVFIFRILLGLNLDWHWFHELFRAIGNSLIVMIFFPFLDRFQITD